VDIVTVLGV